LIYTKDVNILGGRLHSIKKNTDTSIVASKDTGLAINVDKSKYMVKYRDQNSRRSHSTKIDKISFGWVEEFKHLGKNLKSLNSIK